jgi:hypothetical protein
MRMSKSDYVTVAIVLGEHASVGFEYETTRSIALDLADAFAKANPKFDAERFLKAAGVRP